MSKYIDNCYFRWLPNRPHYALHLVKLPRLLFSRRGWKLISISQPKCMTTHADIAWLRSRVDDPDE